MFRLVTCTLVVTLTTLMFVSAPSSATSVAERNGPTRDDVSRGHNATLRHTTLGPVVGVDERATSHTYSWLGIPYAKPPVGNLRWRPTRTHRPWSHVRRTQQYGAGCAQPGRFFSPSPDGPHYDLDVRDGLGKPVGEEDCLTLNVFRPSNAKRNLPVVVFVHGGSNVVGYSGDPMYDGRTLARRANAVVVTVNYRLGLFGWFDHPALKTGNPLADSGNFATLDQIEALRFVRSNARRFGGNPHNVSIMGESAGSVNVWALMTSPLTRGLVDKAIPLSGGLKYTPKADAREYAEKVASAAVADDGGSDNTRAEGRDVERLLRSMPSDDLVRLSLRHELDATPAVIPDGTVMPKDPYGAVASGKYREVPVLAGNTFEEGKMFGAAIDAYRPTAYQRFTWQYEFGPNNPSNLTPRDLLNDKLLPVDKPGGWNDASAALTDSIFTKLNRASMDALTEAGNDDVYYYRFGWNEEPKPFDDVYGAVHAMDLPFVFGNFDKSVASYAFDRANRPGRLELSSLMMRSIATFIRTGNPQHRKLEGQWKQWPSSMVFDATKKHAWARPGTVDD